MFVVYADCSCSDRVLVIFYAEHHSDFSTDQLQGNFSLGTVECLRAQPGSSISGLF